MFNKIENIKNRAITDSFENLEALVTYIRNSNRKEISQILKARKIGKGTEEYKKIKTSEIPCVTINFNHKEYIKSSTIIQPTGYLYLDLDDDIEMGCIDHRFVSAYWRSLSNQGYSVIVKVNGLSQYDLKAAYRYVGEFLDINYDSSAISKDRLTILSYDPSAYINLESEEIVLDDKKETQFNTIENNYLLGYDSNGSKIRYNNLQETIVSLKIDIVYDENGLFDLGAKNKIHFSQVITPFKKIEKGRRNKILSSIIHQLLALNPKRNKNELLALSYYINKNKMSPPLSNNIVRGVFDRKYKNRTKLEPIINASRRFLYDSDKNLNAYEKRCLNARKIGLDKIENSKNKIRRAILSWNYKTMGKITINNIVKSTKMNRKTVVKYYSSIKNDLGIV